MQQWEYLYVRFYIEDEVKCILTRVYASKDEPTPLPEWEGKNLFAFLNDLGQQGWEMIEAPYTVEEGQSAKRLIFKRPIQQRRFRLARNKK
ncbi:MAG: hypothetical protein H0X24_00635 [Ktedonobacterales bacterium]|nr:hypothetical protein [Ktedonobacterales bacterium]